MRDLRVWLGLVFCTMLCVTSLQAQTFPEYGSPAYAINEGTECVTFEGPDLSCEDLYGDMIDEYDINGLLCNKPCTILDDDCNDLEDFQVLGYDNYQDHQFPNVQQATEGGYAVDDRIEVTCFAFTYCVCTQAMDGKVCISDNILRGKGAYLYTVNINLTCEF